MDSENDIYEMCRLCLAKEQVDVHIFEEESEEKQTFLKISTCLPIKISFDDRLPKKICTDCLCKLDAMYQFWNKSISSESQLLTWLDLSSIENVSQPDNRLNSINLHSHIYVKEEPIDCLKTEHDIKLEVMEESYDDESYNQPIKEFPDQESSSHCKRKRDPSPECEINSDDDPLAQDTETKLLLPDSKFHFVQCTLPEVAEAATAAVDVNYLLPTKSSIVYQAAYQKFIRWCDEKNVHNYSERALLEYFFELETKMKMKSSTMWSQYSMIRSLLNIKHGVDISKYLQLRAYLKKQNEGHVPKKSRGFTKEQFEKFLYEASDDRCLGHKIVLIIGISGACRCEEMVKMKVDDIEDLGSLLHIKILNGKANKSRSFTVVEENFINIYRKYAALRPTGMNDQRFFLKYKDGKCHRSVMGIHKIGSVPREVAFYLKLPNWKEYTGHCLRRTSATLLV